MDYFDSVNQSLTLDIYFEMRMGQTLGKEFEDGFFKEFNETVATENTINTLKSKISDFEKRFLESKVFNQI